MTDFEELGLSLGPYNAKGRNLLLTVDFEAFSADQIDIWIKAIKIWAKLSDQYGFKFSFFLAIEHISKLRKVDPDAYKAFLDSMQLLNKAGTIFYPHNHYVFDPGTGEMLQPAVEGKVKDYTKRVSLFYDTVYNHKLEFAIWIKTVKSEYYQFIDDAQINTPKRLAFRAGGWDYGSSHSDLSTYIKGLSDAGFEIDSSACSGVFGTPSWSVGSTFGKNIFQLSNSLVEVAPCWIVDTGAKVKKRTYIKDLLEFRKQPSLFNLYAPGAFVVVIHFDHLFHEEINGDYHYFNVVDSEVISMRIRDFFRRLAFWRNFWRFRDITFNEI